MQIGASFSVGRVAYKHDMRETLKENVDQSRMQDNVVLIDRLQGRSIEEYTNERMQPVIDEYNAKQKRKDRQIKVPYVEYFNNLKDHGELSYEAVLQFGEHDDLGKKYYEAKTPEEKAKMHKHFVDGYKIMLQQMQKNYPHLEILYATIHFDETKGTPHLHVGYQGIGTGYKQGLSQQVSIGNALACDGIERLKSRAEAEKLGGYQISRFYSEFRHKYMIPLLERAGYAIKPEEHGKKHEHQDLHQENEELREQNKELKQEHSDLESKNAEARERTRKAQEQAVTFERGAQRRLEEMQTAQAHLDAITGEARAQELARAEKLKNYKKAPLQKGMYLVPEDDILAFENMGNTQRQLNKKAKELDDKEKTVKQREAEADRAYKRYQEYPGLCRELREKKENLEAEIHKEAVDIFERHYEGALRKMGLWEQVMDFIKKEKQKHISHGWGR